MIRIGVYLLVMSLLSTTPVIAQTAADSMEQSVADFEAAMEVVAQFVSEVEFDEGDIETVLEYWKELDDLDVMSADDDEDSPAGFAKDVRQILASPEYQTWARGHGLEPEDWLRKSMRITMVMVAQELAGQKEMMAAQRDSYAQMVEQSCAQVDEKTCQQMRQSMKQSLAMGEAMMKAAERIPSATAQETALLEKYGSQLQAVMMADDDYGDYGSGYEEDYDEDGG